MTPETEFGEVIEALERLMKPHLPKNPYSGTHVFPTAAWEKGSFPDWEIVMEFLMKRRPAPKAIDVEALKREAMSRCVFDSLTRSGYDYENNQWDTHQIAEGAGRMFDHLNSRGLFGQVDQAAWLPVSINPQEDQLVIVEWPDELRRLAKFMNGEFWFTSERGKHYCNKIGFTKWKPYGVPTGENR